MLNSFLKARGVSYPFQGGVLTFFALAVLLPFVAPAKQISVSPLPVSPYADTEVSTSARERRFSALICRLPEILNKTKQKLVGKSGGNEVYFDIILP